MATNEPVDIDRLVQRVVHYAKAGGASDKATQQMLDMLQSPEGRVIISIPADELDSLLVNDVYKIRMQNMYSHFMTGVTADFALKIRRCKAHVNSKHVLADMRQQQPEVYSNLMNHVCTDLQHMDALDPRVLDALEEYHNGFKPPQAMFNRLSGQGAAPITWTDIDGSPIAIGSGAIESASNTETSCMQTVQAAIIAAAAASRQSNGISCSKDQAVFVFDRTERLANSLGRMVGVVEQINDIPHDFKIMLMAGRRSTDLLHLLLQNLYFMKFVRGYVGTSSVLAAALFKPLLEQLGYNRQQRQQLVQGLLGTHAHEMTSMIQQLLVKYDEEAGRRCGMKVPVCITQLLAHLLFLVANGDQKSRTALPDTFTTPYFITLAMITKPPVEFIEDMASRWGVNMEQHSRVFDIFGTWRLDSGDYPKLAQLLHDSWQQRNAARTAAGLDNIPPLQIIQSNIETVDDIRSLADLPDKIRPHVLGFGGLADGFLAFDPIRSGSESGPNLGQGIRSDHTAAQAGPDSSCCTSSSCCAQFSSTRCCNENGSTTAAGDADRQQQHLELPVCSLVMKAVQARLTADGSSDNRASAEKISTQTFAAAATATAAADKADKVYPLASPNAVSTDAVATVLRDSTSSSTDTLLYGSLQESAVKIGDDDSLAKAQVDPRLPHETQVEVLTRVQAMIHAGKILQNASDREVEALSDVLREAYVAVVRNGVLNAPSAVRGTRSRHTLQ